jgi:hypothetical protein
MQLMADRRATDWRQSETLRLAVPVRDADSTNHARQVDDARHTAAFSAPPCRASRACCVGRFMLLTGEELSLNSFPSSLRLRGLRLPTGARISLPGPPGNERAASYATATRMAILATVARLHPVVAGMRVGQQN